MITLADIPQSTEQEQIIDLTAIIDTALCVGAGGSSGSLADKPILKNAEGRLVIPASQLKGRLRHECEKLASALGWPVCSSPKAERMCPQRLGRQQTDFDLASYSLRKGAGHTHSAEQTHCLICQLFGNPSLPARLQFSDLVCGEPPENIPEVQRPGVSINRRRRTAEEQKLYFVETSPANAKLPFKGQLHLQPPWPLNSSAADNSAANSADSSSFALALIVTGLKHIYALGGGKSAGLGWLTWELNQTQTTIPDEAWAWLGIAASETHHKAATTTSPRTGGDAT